MSASDHYSTDLEWELGMSTYDSEPWSYVDQSAHSLVESDADIFIGNEQSYVSECDDNLGAFSHRDGLAGYDPVIQTGPRFPFPYTPFPDRMSLPSESPRDYLEFHDETWILNPSDLGEARSSSSCRHYSGTHPTSNDPWDPVGPPRVIAHDAGYVVFVNSSESSSGQSIDDSSSRESSCPKDDMTHAFQDTIIDNFNTEPTGIAIQQHLHWDVINTVTDGPPNISNMIMRDADRRQRRGRQGPLNPQRKKEAHAIRKLGGCWPCRVSKAKESFLPNPSLRIKYQLTNFLSAHQGAPARDAETTMHRCHISLTGYAVDLGLQTMPFSVFLVCSIYLHSICQHGLIVTELLTSHFTMDEVENLVAQNVDKFVDDDIAVRLNCGRCFAPLELRVNFFKPKTDSTLLYHHHLTYLGKERMGKITSRCSAPVGILGADIRHLKKKCKLYIASMVSNPDYARQATAGGKLGIYRRALEVICRYSKDEKVR